MFLEIPSQLRSCGPLVCNVFLLMTALMEAVSQTAGGLGMSYVQASQQLNTARSLSIIPFAPCCAPLRRTTGRLRRGREKHACHYAGQFLQRQPYSLLCFPPVFSLPVTPTSLSPSESQHAQL